MAEARIDITGDGTGFDAMLRNAQRSMDGFASSAKSSFGAVGGSVMSAQNALAGFAALLAGGVAKAAIEETVKFNKESNALARTLGITAAEASVLNVALGDIYQDSTALTGAIAKMTRAMNDDEGKINALGVATRESNGAFRNSLTVFQDVTERLGRFKEGTDRNIEAAKIFGKTWQDVLPMLKLTTEGIEQARQKAESLGLVITEQSGKTVADYRASMNDVGDVMLGVKNAISQALMPTLEWMGNWFASIGPGLVLVFKGAIGGLASAFDILGVAVRTAWEIVNAFVVSVAEPIKAIGTAFYKMLSGDMQGAADAVAAMPKVIAGAWTGAFGAITKSATETYTAVVNRFGNGTIAAPKRDGDGSSGGKPKAEAKEVSRVQLWEAELAMQKVVIQEKSALNGTFLEMTKAQELRYWQEIMATRGLNEKESITLRKKTAEISIGLRKDEFESYLASLKIQQEAARKDVATRVLLAEEAYTAISQKYGLESKEAKKAMGEILQERRSLAEQQKNIEQARFDSAQNLKLLEVEGKRAQAQFEVEMGTLTRQQLLQQEAEFEQQKFEIQSQGLEQRKTLIDPQRDPEAYAHLLLQLQELDAQHEAKKSELRLQTTLAATELERGALSELQSSWAGTIKGLMTGTLTFAQGIRQMFKGVVDAAVGMLANMAAKWLVQQITQRVFAQVAARAQVASNAAVAGAAAIASTAAIPIVGPALAPAAGLAASAAAMSFQAMIPAAAKGFDIPFGDNPITQLHQREMVLPADIAEPMREGLAGGRGMGGGDSFTINAMDARSFGAFLKDNAGALADAIRHSGRRGFT